MKQETKGILILISLGMMVILIIGAISIVLINSYKNETKYEYLDPTSSNRSTVELSSDYIYSSDFDPNNVSLGGIKIGDPASKIDQRFIKEKINISGQSKLFMLLSYLFGIDIMEYKGDWIVMWSGNEYFVQDSIVKEIKNEIKTEKYICNQEDIKSKLGKPDTETNNPNTNVESYFYYNKWLSIDFVNGSCYANIGIRIKK